jgi:hypothetical protein
MLGDFVNLHHKEADGPVGCDRRRASLGLPAYILADEASASSNIVWQIHKEDPLDGSLCQWGDRVRLRHVGSDMNLKVTFRGEPRMPGGPPRGSGGEARRGSVMPTVSARSAKEAASSDADALGMAELTADLRSPETLFELQPQYAASGHVPLNGSFFRVRHVESGYWLHFQDPDAAEKRAEESKVRMSGAFESQTPSKKRALSKPAPASRAPSASLSSAEEQRRTLGSLCHVQVSEEDDLDAVPLWASPALEDEDVFGLTTVCTSDIDDLRLAKSATTLMGEFLEQFDAQPPPAPMRVDLKPMAKKLTELILFVTSGTENADPLTREGIPVPARQIILREQEVLDRAMQCIVAPFKATFSYENLTDPHGSAQAQGAPRAAAATRRRSSNNSDAEQVARTQKNERLKRLGVLCMRLCRHLLRDHSANKRYAVRFVPLLQQSLGYGLRAAETLREVFADNAMMLDLVTDAHVSRFVQLIRENGRQARFIDFLQVLTQCNGKAVRPNQWRICRLLLQEAPELLVRLTLDRSGGVLVSGDARYFPAFAASGELPLSEWLDGTTPETRRYFEGTVELCALLVKGRNLKNAATVHALLPYPLVEAVVTSAALNEKFLPAVSQFVSLAMHAYVDHEPHELMTRVKVVRIWRNIDKAAESGTLSSRLTTVLKVNWGQFDRLKQHLLGFIQQYHVQVAVRVRENRMVLLLQCCYHLMRCGFYTSDEVREIIPTLVAVLDGTGDTVGLFEGESNAERYKMRDGLSASTLVMMEAKSTCCKILSLVCTMRVDIRLSKLLSQYKREFDDGKWGPQPADLKTSFHMASFGRKAGKKLIGVVGQAAGQAKKLLAKDTAGGYTQLHDLKEDSREDEEASSRRDLRGPYVPAASRCASASVGSASGGAIVPSRGATCAGHEISSRGRAATADLAASRGAAYAGLFDLLSLEVDLTGDGKSNLVETLMDLSFYEHPELVSQALGLLVRHFQQRSSLRRFGSAVQVLLKPEVVRLYSTFDDLLSQLGRLAARRRLFDNERYAATRLMGLLSMYCYEEGGEEGDGRSHASKLTARSRLAASKTQTIQAAATETDHTAGIYLLLVGRATVEIGSDEVAMTHVDAHGGEARAPRRGDRIQLEGGMYQVKEAALDAAGSTLRIDRPFAIVPLVRPPTHHHASMPPPRPASLLRLTRARTTAVPLPPPCPVRVLASATRRCATRDLSSSLPPSLPRCPSPGRRLVLSRRCVAVDGLPRAQDEGKTVTPPSLHSGRGEVWVMLENRSAGQNLDVQLLLMNMCARPAK